ncbi:unnamed protein product [Symbiodinium sp. KB8]|nr:unnamed protein product [Symbiodinium sp. KB8]
MVMTKHQLTWAFTFWSVLQVAVLNASRFTVERGQGSSLERGEVGQGATGVDAALPPPTLQDWLNTLALQHAQARADAANEIGKLGKEAAEAIPKLAKLLQDDREVAGDICVRDAAVKALGHIGSAAASSVPEILTQLRRRSTRIFREGVSFALANIDLTDWLAYLDGSSARARVDAANEIGKLGKEAAEPIPKLAKLLQDDREVAGDICVRDAAVKALGHMGSAAASSVPEILTQLRRRSTRIFREGVSFALASIGQEAPEAVLPSVLKSLQASVYLDGSSARARVDAANEVGKLGKEASEAIPKLAELLQDDREVAGDICVRDAAVKALGHMGSAAASSVPEILTQLRRRSTRIFREGVSFALASIGQEAQNALDLIDKATD